MAKSTGSKSVPKSMQPTYDAITTLTDTFCRDYLDEDYRELAQRMTAVPEATEPAHLRAAPHLGLWDRLRAGSDQLSDRPINAALHDDG